MGLEFCQLGKVKPRHAFSQTKTLWRDSPPNCWWQTCTSWYEGGWFELFARDFQYPNKASVCHQSDSFIAIVLVSKILVGTCTVYPVLNPGSCPESSKCPPKKKKKNVILLRYVFGIQGIQQPSHSKCLEMTSSCRVRHEHYLAAKAVGCTSKCSPWKEPAAACMGVYSIKYYDMICVCMYICI